MPALRGTRAPEGASLPRHGTGIYREVQLWPGVTWGHDARCSCSWSVRYGVMQVKVRSTACTVHIGGRRPAPVPVPQCDLPPPAESPDAALLAAVRSGTVTRELYRESVLAWREAHRASLAAAVLGPLIGGALEAALGRGDRRGAAGCGTPSGYNRHWLDGTRTCPACRAAKTGAPGAAAEGEAA